jgi:hypothetical protein
MTLVVDPEHWLEDGGLPTSNLEVRRNMLRVAQFIEYGGPVPVTHQRETLIACRRRPKGKQCLGLMWVIKVDETIHAYCPHCDNLEAVIHNWQHTLWAEGPMPPVPPPGQPQP